VAESALDLRLARPERIISLAEEARGIHAALHDSRAVAGALLYRGLLESVHAQYAAARKTLEEAFAQAQQVGDALVAAGSRHAQGVEAHARGHDDEARWLMQQGLDVLPAAPDSGASVWATTIGLVIDRDGHGRTRMYFEDTVLMFREVGAEAARGYMLCDFALVARAQSDYDTAREALDRALALHREHDDHHGTAVALNALGNLARSREQFELGREWLEEALTIRRDMGDRRATAVTLGCSGLLAGRAGHREEGRRLIGRALEIFAEAEDGPGRSGMLLNLGNLELEAGEADRALPILEETAGLFRSQMIMRGWGWPMCTLADAVISAPVPAEPRARSLLEEARGAFGETEDVRGLAQVAALEDRLDGGRSAANAVLDAG
jgi:tetratricopeptide (TPR) repeat protein